eukprot:738336-Pleurochrysis_carterae.AAC.1
MRQETVKSPDGRVTHMKYNIALAEAQTPADESNKAATEDTIELLEVMAAAAIAKMQDPKISVADKL